MGSKATVTDKDDPAVRKPANDPEHALLGPVREFLVSQALFFGIAFGRGKKR